MTIVVADTGDIQSIEQFVPRDATTNPSLITSAAGMPRYKEIVDGTLRDARRELGEHVDPQKVASLAFDRLAVSFGKRILQIVPKRVSTEVDARLSYDTNASVAKGREIIAQYEAAGISRNRILVKTGIDLGRHQGRRNPRKGRHPLQSDSNVRTAPGHRVR